MKLKGLNNGGLKKVVALLLAACISIGLISSTALKLVSATYYMQTKRKLVTNIPVVDKAIDFLTGDNSSSPDDNNADLIVNTPVEDTTAPAPSVDTPANDETTSDSGSETEQTPVDTTSSNSGSQEDTTAVTAGTTSAPTTTTTEPETDSAETIKLKKQILSEYKNVVNLSKKVSKPNFTKTTYRTIDKDAATAVHLLNIEKTYPDYFVSKENAVPVVVTAASVASELCIDNNKYACMLASADASEAIKTATSVKLADGSRKITIVLRDEVNPASTPADATKAESFTSAMFPVIDSDVALQKVNASTTLLDATSATLTYKDCTVELIYDPVLNTIISLTQTVNYTGEFKGYLLLTSTGTVTEVNEYKDFDYSIL